MQNTSSHAAKTTIVVPVYNEEKRLKTDVFVQFVEENPNYSILFANDGSTDGTAAILERLARHPSGRLKCLALVQNAGKAEAVRMGVATALRNPHTQYVGYLDADLSTPIAELTDFVKILDEKPQVVMVLGSRVKLLGRLINRRALRHYLGRVFATAASLVLNIGVYDTQCGAKMLRATPDVRQVFAQKFLSRWIFDVEIIARLARELGLKSDRLEATMVECPVMEWQEIAGSKVRPKDFLIALLEILSIHKHYKVFLR